MVEEKKMLKADDEVVKTPTAPGFPRRSPIQVLSSSRRCLTSVIRRERVCSSWYGRRHDSPFLRLLLICYVSAHLPGVFVLLFRAL